MDDDNLFASIVYDLRKVISKVKEFDKYFNNPRDVLSEYEYQEFRAFVRQIDELDDLTKDF